MAKEKGQSKRKRRRKRRRTKMESQNDGERKKNMGEQNNFKIGRETLSGDTIKPTISLQTLCNAN